MVQLIINVWCKHFGVFGGVVIQGFGGDTDQSVHAGCNVFTAVATCQAHGSAAETNSTELHQME